MFVIFRLKSIRKQSLVLVYGFLNLKCVIKTIIGFGFCSARLITLTETLIILHITKTESNNCLLLNYYWMRFLLLLKLDKQGCCLFTSFTVTSKSIHFKISICLPITIFCSPPCSPFRQVLQGCLPL